MKMSKFHYHRPTAIAEAVEMLGDLGDEAKPLAGGQSLLPMMALRLAVPEHLVDVGVIPELALLEVGADGWLSIGAAVTHATVEHSAEVGRVAPLVVAAMPHVGHRAIRNRGTVCGSVAHADPAAELPAVMLALGAEMVVMREEGVRSIPAAEFFTGSLQTVLDAGDLLTEIRVPPPRPLSGWSIQELSRRHGDFAMVGVAVDLVLDADGRVDGCAIACFGAAGTPVRVPEAERLLEGQQIDDELLDDAAAAAKGALDPPADVHASSEYRAHALGVLTKRAVAEAAGRARVEVGE